MAALIKHLSEMEEFLKMIKKHTAKLEDRLQEGISQLKACILTLGSNEDAFTRSKQEACLDIISNLQKLIKKE